MTCRDAAIHTHKIHFPGRLLTPIAAMLLSVYPAIWNTAPLIRHTFSTVLVVGFVWTVLALWATFSRVVHELVDRRIEDIKGGAFAEVDALDEADWRDFMRGLEDPPGTRRAR